MSNQYRYLIYASYFGTRYRFVRYYLLQKRGSQRITLRGATNNETTIQEALEASLGTLGTKSEPILTSASRTDRGVHCISSGFTVQLEPKYNCGYYSTQHVMDTCNVFLSKNYHDIKVNRVLLVPRSFHPQAHVDWREYRYKVAVVNRSLEYPEISKPRNEPYILNHLLPMDWIYRITPLRDFDIHKANEALKLLQGYHNLASFTRSIIQKNPKSTWKTVDIKLNKGETLTNVDLDIEFDTYEFSFRSRSFLYQQIRRMMGCILSYCSYGSIKLDKIWHLLDNPTTMSWNSNLVVAPSWGLYLDNVHFKPSSFIFEPEQQPK